MLLLQSTNLLFIGFGVLPLLTQNRKGCTTKHISKRSLEVRWKIQDRLTEATVKIKNPGSGNQQLAITY